MVYAYGPDGFAQKRVVPYNPNAMGYPFPSNTRAVRGFFFFFFFCPLYFYEISLFVSVINLPFFELQTTIQKHEELVWLARNLKLEVTKY